MTCTHPMVSIRKEKHGPRTHYTCEACGANRTDIVLGRKLHMGEWSGGKESQEDRFDDLMDELTAWAVETGNEVLVIKIGRDEDSPGYHLMGRCSGLMQLAVKWTQESLFGRGEGGPTDDRT